MSKDDIKKQELIERVYLRFPRLDPKNLSPEQIEILKSNIAIYIAENEVIRAGLEKGYSEIVALATQAFGENSIEVRHFKKTGYPQPPPLQSQLDTFLRHYERLQVVKAKRERGRQQRNRSIKILSKAGWVVGVHFRENDATNFLVSKLNEDGTVRGKSDEEN